MLRNDATNYGTISRLIHWTTAAVILALVFLGIYMSGLPEDAPNRMMLYGLHKSFGALTVLLLVARFAWFRVTPAPELPSVFGAGERKFMTGLRVLLYALMLLIPVGGYVMSTAAGYPVPFFGLFNMPALVPENEALAGIAHASHGLLGYTILAVVVVHVGGALKHRLTDKDGEGDVLARML